MKFKDNDIDVDSVVVDGHGYVVMLLVTVVSILSITTGWFWVKNKRKVEKELNSFEKEKKEWQMWVLRKNMHWRQSCVMSFLLHGAKPSK